MHPLRLLRRQHEPAPHAGFATAQEYTVQQGYPSDLSKPGPMGDHNDPSGARWHGYSTLVADVIPTASVGTVPRRTTRKSKGRTVNTAMRLQLDGQS